MWTQNQDDLGTQIYGVMLKCRLSLNWNLVLSLTLIWMSGCHKTTQTTPECRGMYSTAQVRELWMGCSNAIYRANPFSRNRIQLCDCSTDVVRKNFKPSFMDNMTESKFREMQTVIKLNCNSWRLGG